MINKDKLKHFIVNVLNHIKWFFQRIFRGYSDYDFWDFGEFACRKILPYLKKWVAMERHGYPEDVGSFEEWNKILDEIVWAVEETATQKDEDAVHEKYGGFLTDNRAYTELEAIWKRQERGMELFGKYIGAMWE